MLTYVIVHIQDTSNDLLTFSEVLYVAQFGRNKVLKYLTWRFLDNLAPNSRNGTKPRVFPGLSFQEELCFCIYRFSELWHWMEGSFYLHTPIALIPR